VSKRPKIRQATFEDYPQIAALHIRNGLPVRSLEDWMALWKSNPVYRQFEGRWPIGWVLETDAGDIVGSIGNIPLAYQFRGRELRAAAACAWAVDAAYRNCSLLLLDHLTRQKDVDLLVCTTVSSRSEPALNVFEWSRAPVGTWDKSVFWITNYRGFAKTVLTMKSVPFAGVISYPVSAALFCREKFKVAGAAPKASTPEIELCADFDSRFDEFWEELKEQNDNVLLAVRTRETLAWHFQYSQMRRSVWILTACKGSRLVAYVVFDRQDNIASGLKRVRFVDFQALKGSEEALRSAVCWMLHQCREQGIHILENVGCWLERPGLPSIPAPDHRTLPSSLYYYKASDSDLCETLKNPAVWAPSSFDGDASL
jgi:hypothetical protein